MKNIKNYQSFVNEGQKQFESDSEEVILGKMDKTDRLRVGFSEGQSVLPPPEKKDVKKDLSKKIKELQNIPQLIEFLGKNGTKNVPAIFKIVVGTSHTGGGAINRTVAEGRLKTMRDILIEVLNEDYYLKPEQALSLIVDDQKYNPSSTDSRFIDTSKMPPNFWERCGEILVNKFVIKGLNPRLINFLGSMLRKAKGYNINPDETAIVNAICACQTFSDILELNQNLLDQGGLEKFINSTINYGFFGVHGHDKERETIKNCLNKISQEAGKGEIAQTRLESDGFSEMIILNLRK